MTTEKESLGPGKLEEDEDQDKTVDNTEASEVGKAKKNKKRKKKKAPKDQQTEPEGEAVASSETSRTDSVNGGKIKHTIITPTPDECFLCGTPRHRSISDGLDMAPPGAYNIPGMKGPLWACPRCRVGLEESSKLAAANLRQGDNAVHTLLQPSLSYVSSSAEECTCQVCTEKRENSQRSDSDIHTSQTYWMEVRNVVRCIYRDPTIMLNDPVSRATLTSSDMFVIVNRLCSKDPHQFFQRLETLTREYLLEVKVRLLEQLSLGYNTIPLAIKFIQMMVNEYSSLCKALPSLLLLLQPLDEENFVAKLGVTVELMNKNIFRELIFAETFMSSNLPLITAQLKLASLSSDPNNRKAADLLHQRYMALDQEMEEIGRMWAGAKTDLSRHAKRKENHIQEMKDDAEVFRELRKTAVQAGFIPPYHFHHFFAPTVSVFTVPPETYTVKLGTLAQAYTIEVDVFGCRVLHQALLDAPIRCMTVKGVELTLLDVFPHFGMKMDTSHVKLTDPPPPPKKPSGEGEGQNGTDDLVSPVEETSRNLATVSPRTIHAIQSVIFKLVISVDSPAEKEALYNWTVIPYSKNITVTVLLKEVQMRSSQKFVNSSEKEYAMYERGAVLSPCEKSNMVVFWDELQACWDRYRGEAPSSPPVPKADPTTQPKEDTKDHSPTDKSLKRADSPADSGTSDEVKPLYELTLSGKCECSACISSMAARYTQDSFRLLDPTDPFGNQLELLDTGTGSTRSAKSFSGETLPKFPITTDVKGPLTCVHVANVGSGKSKVTSGTQTPAMTATRHDNYTTIDIHKPGTLIVSGLIKTHPNMFGHHHHHGNGSGDPGKDADAMETSLDSSKANHHHGCDSCCEHAHQAGATATTSSCKSDSLSTANGNSSSHGNGTGSGTDSNTGDGSGSQKRYCRCCYCELFGPNGPAPVATSHNYRFYRERMRQKLEKKKDTGKPEEEETPSASSTTTSSGKSDQPTVEKLLEFIEGPQEEPKLSARAAKRLRRKQRKKGKGKKDGKGGDDGDDDDDDKWTASHEGSESDGDDSAGENEEIVEVQIPTQPLYRLDPIEDDDIVVHTKTPEQHATPTRKTDTPPLVNGDTSPTRTEQAPPLSNDASSNGNSTATVHAPRQRSQQQPSKGQYVQRSDGSRQVTSNGHPSWHGSSLVGKRSDLSHPQNKRSYGHSPQRDGAGAAGNSESQQQYTSQRNVRPRAAQSFPSNRLHQLPPRFQRQAQEQMQSTQQQRPVAPRYQQRGGYGHHQHGHHGGQSILGNPPGEDVFLPGDEGDKEVEEFKRFCMKNTPMENRKKITASVNFKDLVAKK